MSLEQKPMVTERDGVASSAARQEYLLPFSLRLLRGLPIPRKLGLLERLYGARLASAGIRWVRAANGVLWKLDLSDVCHRWITYGSYEGPRQAAWVQSWLGNGGIVVDSGANIGEFVLGCAGIHGVVVLAFEPRLEAAEWLEQCVRHYPDWDVRVVRLGLSSKTGYMEIQLDGPRSTSRMDWYRGKSLPTDTVPVSRLDEYLEASGIERVRLWKLDVEGHESAALRGASRFLEEKRIDAILIEVGQRGKEVEEVLRQYGYRLYSFSTFGLRAGIPHCGNAVAFHCDSWKRFCGSDTAIS